MTYRKLPNVSRINPNGPEPVTVLESALDEVDYYEDVIVIGIEKDGNRSVYASRGVGAKMLSFGSVVLQDLAIQSIRGEILQDWKPSA